MNEDFGFNPQANRELAATLADQFMRRTSPSLPADELAAFLQQPPAQYREFSEALAQAMDMPVVRTRNGQKTPNEALEIVAAALEMSPESVENARRSFAGVPIPEGDESAQVARDTILDQLRKTLPGGPSELAYDPGATPEQAAEFDKRGPMEAAYALTPGGEQGYQAQRVYDLLSTFQEGTHAPTWSTVGSRFAGAVAGVVGLPAALAGRTEVDRQYGRDNMRLAADRLANTPAGRVDEALYWWNRGQPDGTLGDSMTGSKFPRRSWTTLEGLGTNIDNPDFRVPYYAFHVPERAVYNYDLPAGDLSVLQRMRSDLLRATPRYPEGADPAEMRKLTQDLQDYDTFVRGYANAYYPERVRKYGIQPQAFTMGHDFMGQPGETPALPPIQATYLSPFGEMMANLPADIPDGLTALSLGTGGVLKGAKLLSNLADSGVTASRQAAKQAAKRGVDYAGNALKEGVNEFGQETVQGSAIAAGNNPDSGFFTPMTASIVRRPSGSDDPFDPGEPVDPNDRYYARWLEDVEPNRKKMLGSLLERGYKVYGRPANR